MDSLILTAGPSFNPSETYTLTQRGGVVRGSDGAFVPEDAGNADWRAFLAWRASGKEPSPIPAPPFDAGAVKAECGRRIYAVASDSAQKNMLANIAAGLMSEADKALFDAGVAWIGAMQEACRALKCPVSTHILRSLRRLLASGQTFSPMGPTG
jgi:hypothetical protein